MGTYQLSILLLFLLFPNGEGTSTCAADVAILVDTSGSHPTHANSVGIDNSVIVCDFIEKLINSMQIGDEGTRIAIAGVSHGRDMFHSFKDSQDMNSIKQALKVLKRMENKVHHDHPGHGRTMEGLQFVRTHIFDAKFGDRAGSPNVIIFVTGSQGKGMNDNLLQMEVSKIKEMAHIIPVTMDPNVKLAMMDPLASSPGVVYDVEKASQVSNAITQVLDDICNPPPSTL